MRFRRCLIYQVCRPTLSIVRELYSSTRGLNPGLGRVSPTPVRSVKGASLTPSDSAPLVASSMEYLSIQGRRRELQRLTQRTPSPATAGAMTSVCRASRLQRHHQPSLPISGLPMQRGGRGSPPEPPWLALSSTSRACHDRLVYTLTTFHSLPLPSTKEDESSGKFLALVYILERIIRKERIVLSIRKHS